MAYRDIDYSMRVNGDISVPGHSLYIGGNTSITNSAITAPRFNGAFHGNGANLTNLSVNAMAGALKVDGSRPMTGPLTINGRGDMLRLIGDGDQDFRIRLADSFDDSGFEIIYAGTGTGVNNTLDLYTDGYHDSTRRHVARVWQDGEVRLFENLRISKNIIVDGTVDGVDVANLKRDFDAHDHSQYIDEEEFLDAMSATETRLQEYVQSRGETVVTNGNGLMGDNTNFSSFEYDPSEVYAGMGSFYTDRQDANLFNDEYIPVNPALEYRLSAVAKSSPYTGARTHIGINPYDIDGLSIDPYYYNGYGRKVHTLAKDLKPGDTVIHLSGTEDINDTSSSSHFRSLAFYGYKNSYGYEYPAGTYTRDVLTSAWALGAVDRTNHTITLSAPFSKQNPNDPEGIYRAGHPVAGTQSGGSYLYITDAFNTVVPDEWTEYSGLIQGTGKDGEQFPPGTAFVRIVFRMNQGASGSGTYLNNVSFALNTQTALNMKDYTYSKAESDDKFEAKGTTHDDRYYQKSEVDTRLNSKSNTGHTHTFASLTSKPTTLSEYGITAQYYTQGESETRYGTPIQNLQRDLRTAEEGLSTLGNNLGDTRQDLQEKLDAAKADLENLEIGGRNLMTNSNDMSIFRPYPGGVSITHEKLSNGYTRVVSSGQGGSSSRRFYFAVNNEVNRHNLRGRQISISFDIINNKEETFAIIDNALGNFKTIDVSEKETRVKIEGVIPNIPTSHHPQVHFMTRGDADVLDISFRNIKVESGNKSTDHTPAPEDIEAEISALLQRIENIDADLKKKSNVGHVHNSLDIPDTRDASPTPSDIPSSTLSTGFIFNRNIGQPPVSNGSSYAHVLNMNGWRSGNNGTGGHTSQLAFGDGLAIRLSTSTTDWGPWRQFWHSGNLNPSNLLTTGSGQSTGNGFSVGGRLLVGSVSNQNGDVIVYNNTGQPTIHLDGNSSGIESASNTKVYVDGNGNMKLSATAEARVLKATVSADAPRINTERINDVRVDDMTKNHSIADTGGWGVQSGMDGEAYGGELHVQPGVAYTKSGRRVEITTRTKVVMRPASSSGRRYDVLYIKGPSASTEEGEFGYFEGSVGGSEQSSITNRALDDAVILASIRRDANQASITQGNINNTVRTQSGIIGERPLYVDGNNQNVKVRYTVEANAFHEGGRHLNTIYSTLAGGNTFTSNQVFNGRIRIQSSGTLSGSHSSGNYSVRMGNSSHYIATDGKEFLASSDMVIGANSELTLRGTRVNVEGPVKASRNATTVSIPAGETRATWTHNYGNTNYAVNLTTNSFERHVRWDNKANNTITIEIDDATDKEILVDCILMGY